MDSYPLPQAVAKIDSDDWSDLVGKSMASHNQMANLMMAYLQEQKGDKFIGGLSNYFHCLVNAFTREKPVFPKVSASIQRNF